MLRDGPPSFRREEIPVPGIPVFRKVPRLPTVTDAPRPPKLKLAPLPLRFIRMPGASVMDSLKRKAMPDLYKSCSW